MSGVDVLAVMDVDGRAVACVIDDCSPGTLRQRQWEAHLQQHDAARAAVAELIAAARDIRCTKPTYSIAYGQAEARLDAAIEAAGAAA